MKRLAFLETSGDASASPWSTTSLDSSGFFSSTTVLRGFWGGVETTALEARELEVDWVFWICLWNNCWMPTVEGCED